MNEKIKTINNALILKYLLLFTMLSANPCFSQTTFKNPVIPGFYPDPSVCRVNDDYYLVTSSFEYFPGVPVFHSKDLVNWEQIGHCLTRDSQLPLIKCRASGGIYAPTIRYHDGLFYMVTTNVSGPGNFFVTATDPAGEWSEPVRVNQGGIDPTIFWDENGKSYFMSNGHQFSDGTYRGGILLSEIDLKTGKRLNEPVPIWDGTGGRYPEAPHMYKKDGYYYLLISEGGTEYGHKATIARSKYIYGPYESCPFNPILTHINHSTESSPIQGTGHADLIQAHDGTWWTVFLAFRPQNGNHHLTGRETNLAPVSWPKNGWPSVNGNGTVSVDMDCPTLPLRPFAPKPIREEFNNPAPSLSWNYLRNPARENYHFGIQKSKLSLKGSALTLNEADSPTFLGRRQDQITFQATTLLSFSPDKSNEEAGLTVIMNEKYHFEIVKNKGKLTLRYQLGVISHIEKVIDFNGKTVYLRIEGTPEFYYFSFSKDNINFQPLGKANTNLISTETAGGFTGIYLGLFASGNGQMNKTLAEFDWFDYSAK